MKKNKLLYVRSAAFLVAAIALCSLLAGSLPASANSAQTSWSGLTSGGALVMDEQCPVEVEAEYLTFNISSYPSNYYSSYSEFLEYDASVTAEYHLYNPADYDVTINLAFPFGKLPDYADGIFYSEDYDPAEIIYQNNILVDGEEVERTLRHTYTYAYSDYDNETDKARLRDDFLSEGLFSPEAVVTCYVYEVSTSSDYQVRAVASFPEFDYTKTAFLCDAGGVDGNDRVFSRFCRNGETFAVYAIGESIDPMIWSIEDGSCELVDTISYTLKELVMQSHDEESVVSEIDWFNAVCDRIMSSRREVVNDFVYYYVTSFSLSYSNLLRWYTYTIEIPAGGRVVNSVTAPVYPAINSRSGYYTYEYYLSPAGDWANFANLTIIINTSYYLNGSSLEGFEEFDGGYIFTSESLPSGELKFVLSSSPDLSICFGNDGYDPYFSYGDLYENLGAYIVLGIIAAAIVALVVWFIIRRVKKRRKKLT